jgi:hypothetical protein
MAYAVGATHYHRLPALHSVFKSLLESLIARMMDKEVWGYWYLTSQSGRTTDPDIEELRKPWPNPVVKENIMACRSVFVCSTTRADSHPSILGIFF